jgi:hypothetical protein
MRNVHLLPTDKPSRLVKFFTNKFHLCKEILPIQDEEQYQHIYITSDEEIKEGDWFYTSQYNTIDKLYSNGVINANYCKKIILTTDQDLIKEGVQPIDNKFLEWFVKNPKCESVEVVHKFDEDWSEESGAFEISYYKIIIPKEEPNKTHYLDELPNMDKKVLAKMWESAMPKLEPKQETLEEVIKTYCKNKYGEGYYPDVEKSIEFGAKWQSERMYSEEEVKHIVSEALQSALVTIYLEQWFKQFKKK